jgi:hypothetical protein
MKLLTITCLLAIFTIHSDEPPLPNPPTIAERILYANDDDMIILDLNSPSDMPLKHIAKRILYADADIVCLRSLSKGKAKYLWELLESNYGFFIRTPPDEPRLIVFIKNSVNVYPSSFLNLSEPEKEKNAPDVLTLVIREDYREDCSIRIGINDSSIQVVNAPDNHTTLPILFANIPGTLTIIKQIRGSTPQYFGLPPLQFFERADLRPGNKFEIHPRQKRGKQRMQQ